MQLSEYIKQNFPSAAAFAAHMNVTPQAVTKWLRQGWVVIDDVIYAPRRIYRESNNKHNQAASL